ncbi:hypothetical protein H5410_040518, partial [Solanum commersonii]
MSPANHLDLPHRQLVRLHQKIEVISETKTPEILELDLLSLRIVWYKGLLGPPYVLSVVQTTQERVVIALMDATLVDRTTLRRATLETSGEENRLYAITSRQEQENSLDIVTGMLKVFTFDVYALLDL